MTVSSDHVDRHFPSPDCIRTVRSFPPASSRSVTSMCGISFPGPRSRSPTVSVCVGVCLGVELDTPLPLLPSLLSLPQFPWSVRPHGVGHRKLLNLSFSPRSHPLKEGFEVWTYQGPKTTSVPPAPSLLQHPGPPTNPRTRTVDTCLSWCSSQSKGPPPSTVVLPRRYPNPPTLPVFRDSLSPRVPYPFLKTS